MARYIDAEKLKAKLHVGDELREKFNTNPAVAQLISIEKDIVTEMEKHIDETPTEDVVGRNSVLEMLSKINNAVEDGDGFQFNEWVEYAKDIPSAEKTDGDLITEIDKLPRIKVGNSNSPTV